MADQETLVDELHGIVHDLVDAAVDSGDACDDPTLSCPCMVCRAIRILARDEGAGRCVICGCNEDHACEPEGRGWADETRRICDRHPPEDVATAKLVLAKEARRG